VAAGADGLFIETHKDPDQALCDGPNSMPLDELSSVLEKIKAIRSAL
jgi:2-dehydro-3-deoxyphosphooctonate aldolase (KDO 8-P synthase)